MVFKKLAKSFRYAFEGVWYCIGHERNFRVHITAALLVCLIAPYYALNIQEKLLLSFTIALVLIMEMLNTALERLVNLVTEQRHPLAKIVKDVAAGMVLLSAFNAVFVGILLFAKWERIQLLWADVIQSPFKMVLAVAFLIGGYFFVRGWNKDV